MFLEALRINPRSEGLHWGLGFGYEQVSRLFQAEQAFRTAATLDPASNRAWSGLTRILLQRLDFVAAERAARAAVETNKGDPANDYYRLAIALAGQDRLESAAINLGIAVARRPDVAEWRQKLAAIEAELAERRRGKTHRHGLILGTGAIIYSVQPRSPTGAAERERADRMIRMMLRDRDGKPPAAYLDTRDYDFLIGIASSHDNLRDLRNRVIADNMSAGRYSLEAQVLYGKIKGRSFDVLDCHSNGAMVCLAALYHRDASARHVRLFGPQISAEALAMWDQLVRSGQVGSIEVYIAERDPIPTASYLLDRLQTGRTEPNQEMATLIRRRAPSIHVTRLGCEHRHAYLPFTFQCHYMEHYLAALARPRADSR